MTATDPNCINTSIHKDENLMQFARFEKAGVRWTSS
jgi:hypothetical protein